MTIREWIDNEWFYYALLVDIPPNIFWGLTPKTIQVYFRAYNQKRKTIIQDIWLQGSYMRQAIISSLSFSNKKPPDYPEMPFKDEADENAEQDEEWVKAQRAKVWNYFNSILSRSKKGE